MCVPHNLQIGGTEFDVRCRLIYTAIADSKINNQKIKTKYVLSGILISNHVTEVLRLWGVDELWKRLKRKQAFIQGIPMNWKSS